MLRKKKLLKVKARCLKLKKLMWIVPKECPLNKKYCWRENDNMPQNYIHKKCGHMKKRLHIFTGKPLKDGSTEAEVTCDCSNSLHFMASE